MAAVVLAGGESRRMGRDKPFLEFRGRPLVKWVAERLQQAGFCRVDVILVVAPAARLEGFAALGLRAVADVYAGRGPLAGLHAGLAAAGPGHHFVIACDQPLFEPRAVRYLLECAENSGRAPDGQPPDAVVPWAAGHLQVLHAVYHRRAADVAEQLLRAGESRLARLLDHLKWHRVDEEELRPFGDPVRMFFNVNTPQDVETMRRFEGC